MDSHYYLGSYSDGEPATRLEFPSVSEIYYEQFENSGTLILSEPVDTNKSDEERRHGDYLTRRYDRMTPPLHTPPRHDDNDPQLHVSDPGSGSMYYQDRSDRRSPAHSPSIGSLSAMVSSLLARNDEHD